MDFIIIVCSIIAVVCGGFALIINIGLKISDIKDKKAKEQREKEQYDRMIGQIERSTWCFPIETFQQKCNEVKIAPPLNESTISKAKKAIQEILFDLKIPEKYHSKYLTEEKINWYFEEIEKSDYKKIVQWIRKEASTHKIVTISNEAEYQKAKLVMIDILKKANINPLYHSMYLEKAKIKECFASADARKREEQDRKRQRQLEKTKEKEAQLVKEYSKDLKFIGKEKTTKFIKKQIAFFESQIEACKIEYDCALNNTSKKSMKYDKKSNTWAYQGGIANAIAGPAAGVMMASDAKRRDDERNQRNAELSAINIQLFALQSQRIKSEQAKFEAELKFWKNALNSMKYQLEEWQDADDLLTAISPKVNYYYSSETGAVRLKIAFNETPNLKIYGDKRAYVDGSVLVEFWDNDEVCGTAVCYLPYGGTSKNCESKCICTQTHPLNKNKKYTINFRPNKLWAMEYTDEIRTTVNRLEKYYENNSEIQ